MGKTYKMTRTYSDEEHAQMVEDYLAGGKPICRYPTGRRSEKNIESVSVWGSTIRFPSSSSVVSTAAK
jgi:hypothetical protein